ncbi:MAG TPA: GNAT family N-acetyltransferase [Streptosporangiaceae bacterium]|nr:GNAT family N-acetyltransferase [Streptosporangiaceae bacterium]
MLSRVGASDVQIRRAHPDDWITVRDLRLAALTDAPEAFAATLGRELGRTEPEWRARISAWPWFLAWRAGKPAGLVAIVPGQAGTGQAGTGQAGTGQDDQAAAKGECREWHLVSMWVNPTARGTGIADLLISEVIEHARVTGASRVTLWVALGNSRARAVYLRTGFAPTGKRQVYRRAGAADLDEEELARAIDALP